MRETTIRMRVLTGLLLVAALLAGAAARATPADDAQALLQAGKPDAALIIIDRALKADRNNPDLQFVRGLCLVDLKRGDEAMATFKDLTEKHPELPEPYNNLAVLQAQAGHYDEARQTLETLLKSHPSYASAQENLGDVYAALSGAAYNRALTLDAGNTRLQAKLAEINKLNQVSSQPGMIVPAGEDAPGGGAALDKDIQTVLKATREWAAAWSLQDADAYLSFYAPDYQPDGASSHRQWALDRRRAIRAHGYIRVRASSPDAERLAADRIRVRFLLEYDTDTDSDESIRILEFRKIGARWLIDSEEKP